MKVVLDVEPSDLRWLRRGLRWVAHRVRRHEPELAARFDAHAEAVRQLRG